MIALILQDASRTEPQEVVQECLTALRKTDAPL